MRIAIAILMLMAAAGCDATIQRFRNISASPADEYRRRAKAHEEASELQQAMLAWNIAGQLDQGDTAIAENLQRIEKQIARKARGHYQKGLNHLRTGKPAEARRELLTVLRLDPTHRQALYYLKKRLQLSDRSVYKVQPGDSFTKIASTVYHDPSKAYVVAYFNDLDPRKPLPIGTALVLPRLDPKYLYPRSDIEKLLAAAERAYLQKQYAKAVSLASNIIQEIPGHVQARKLVQSARFEHGMQLKRRGRYLAALEQLKQTAPRYKGRREALAEIRRLISQQALDEKLAAARSLLKRGKLTEVISITQAILEDSPGNVQANALQNEAGYLIGKSLIEQDQPAESIRWLEKIDPAYADTAQQLSLARARTKSAAEERYRNGVKHFINDNLAAAIKDWQQALDLNPDHPKARQDMEKAMRLLEKWRALEQTPKNKTTAD